MKVYQSGQVLLLSQFPFSDMTGAKRRPALVLLDTGDEDIVVARITGQLTQADFDVELAEWKQAGLIIASVVRLHKVATMEKSLVERELGTLAPDDWTRVRAKVQELWADF